MNNSDEEITKRAYAIIGNASNKILKKGEKRHVPGWAAAVAQATKELIAEAAKPAAAEPKPNIVALPSPPAPTSR